MIELKEEIDLISLITSVFNSPESVYIRHILEALFAYKSAKTHEEKIKYLDKASWYINELKELENKINRWMSSIERSTNELS